MDQANEGILSPFLRSQRVKQAIPWLRGRVLDFGCGSGALCESVGMQDYVGFDLDAASLDVASAIFPGFTFVDEITPNEFHSFDTVVALAVLEHVSKPANLLEKFASLLRPSSESRIVITTPHPRGDSLHHWGARMGLFSNAAHEEHEVLLNKNSFMRVLEFTRLDLLHYRRFLLGMNQIFVLGLKK